MILKVLFNSNTIDRQYNEPAWLILEYQASAPRAASMDEWES